MQENFLHIIQEFIILFIELSFLFIFISTLVALLNQRYKNFFNSQLKSTSFSSYFKAIFLGSITPFCSCSTIPLLSAFLKNGISLGVCSAYLLTSPLINPIMLIMLFLSFGFKLSSLYILFLVFCIFIFSLMISKFDPKLFLLPNFYPTNKPKFSLTPPSSVPKLFAPQQLQKVSLRIHLQQSIKDYKKLFPYIAIGMGIGAGIHGFIPQELLIEIFKEHGALSIVLSAFLGILLYIRASMIIPIGLILIEGGVPSEVVMSFLIAGAGCSLPELILLKGMFKMRFLALFVGIVLSVGIGFGFLLEFLGV